jgi:multiple sugar transport system ATP-binding protein
MARIRFDTVTKRYANGVIAVDRLNLDIADREFVVLLGPSGCGKSTTLNMIAGLEDVSEGNLYFDNDLVNWTPPHQRDAAMVFQSYALYPHKSVYENIAFGLRMRKFSNDEIDRRVKSVAARLSIAELLERRPGQLSGGQRQRVALGRAIVRQPAVFLMDEPLSNLDAALRISMRAEIKELHRTMQTTFVYVTHDQAEALTLADRIVVMQHGIVQQIGTADEIYERPSNIFVASFLGNPPINLIEGVLDRNNGRLLFRRGELSLPIEDSAIANPTSNVGRTVTIGIRPEDITPNDEGALRGAIAAVLPVGSDQFLGLDIAGDRLFFRVPKGYASRIGEMVAFAPSPGRVHLFDPSTGASLHPGASR